MENRNVPVNHLVNRLYKNFSETRIQQKSLLSKNNSSIMNDLSCKPKNSLMHSSIRDNSSRKSLLFDDKRMLIQDISMISVNQPSVSNHKNRFSKMLLEDSSISEADTLQSEYNINKLKQKLKQNKGRVIKKKAVIRSKNKGQVQGAEDRDLTLLDFLNLMKQQPDLSDEFVYLKVMSHPYDLQIVDYDQRSLNDAKRQKRALFNKKAPLPSTSNKHDRITVSSRGIAYLNQDDPVFVSIEDWLKQAELYQKLTNLTFFKQYRVWKNFCVWKKFIRRISMKKVSQILSRQLLFTDKHIRPSILFSKSLLLRLQNVKLCKINESQKQVPTYVQFKEEQNRFRTQDLPNNINYIEQQILGNVIDACKQSLKAFKQQNRIGNIESGIGGKVQPLLIGDNSNKPMPYTEEATIKTHHEKLTKFMKLVDNMIVDGKLKLIFESLSNLRHTIQGQNQQYYTDVIMTKQKLIYKGHQWFLCQIFFQSSKLTFNPDCSRLQSVFQQLVNKGVSYICKKHKSIRTSNYLSAYIAINEQRQDLNDDIFDLQEVVRTNETFVKQQTLLVKQIDKSFTFVQKYCQRLIPFLQIYINNNQQNLNSYRLKQPEEIQKAIDKWKNEDKQLNSIVEQHQSSMLLIHTGKLKQTIKNCASVCLQHIYKMLPEMLANKTKQLKTQLSNYTNKVINKPQIIEQFIQLNQNVNSISFKVDDLSFKVSQVSALYNIIKQNRSNMQQNMQTLKPKQQKVNQLNQKMVLLRVQIDKATMNMNNYKVVFLQQINKIPVQINRNVQENYSQVSTYDYSTQISKIVQFLKQKQKSLELIFEDNKKLNFYQKNLQTEETDSEILNKYSQYFNKMYRIWTYKQKVNEFATKIKTSKLATLDVDESWNIFEKLLIDVQTLSKQCFVQEQEQQQFQLSTEDKTVILKLQEQVISYSPVMKSIKAMKNQILKERQWDEIRQHFESKGINVQTIEKIKNSTCTLDVIMDKQIWKQSKFLTQLTIKANHQAELIAILQKISSFWTTNYINCSPYLEYKDVFTLDSNLQLYKRIDENLVDLEVVMNSKYIDTVIADAEKQSKMFCTLQQVLQQWKIQQKNWITLQPLLNSAYFKAFPKQMKAFSIADNNWRKIVKVTKQQPVKKWAQQQNIMQTLKNNSIVYSNIKKLIPDFLQKKRQIFPRFYFLSDDQLIEILSKCKDFKSTQQYLFKIFPSIQKFEYNAGDKQSPPSGLVNFDGEILPLKMMRVGVQGEQIFRMLQQYMKQSIKSLIKQSTIAIEKDNFKRKTWIKQYPFQVCHLVDLLQWTKTIQNDYLCPQSSQQLSNLYYSQHLQLNQIIQMINDPTLKINPVILNTMLVQNIQYRDVIEKLIIQNVDSINDFIWAMQVKAHYQNQVYSIRQMENQIMYGFEFLRIFNKVPICPQTQKSRFGLFQAMNDKQALVIKQNSSLFSDFANICGKNLVNLNLNFVNKNNLQSVIQGTLTTGSWLILKTTKDIKQQQLSQIATIISIVKNQYLKRQSNQKLRQIGIALNVCHGQQLSPIVKNEMRSISIITPGEWFLLEIKLYKQGLIWAKQFIKQLKPLIEKIEITLNIKVSITKLYKSYKSLYVSINWDNSQTISYIMSATRNHIVQQYSLEQLSVSVIFSEYLNPKNITLQIYNQPKIQIQDKFVTQNPIIIEGNIKSGKSTQVLNEYSKRHPQDPNHQNILFIQSNALCWAQLLGSLQQKTWSIGLLQQFILKNDSQKWIIIEEPSNQTKLFFQQALTDNLIILPSLYRLQINSNKLKIIYQISSQKSFEYPSLKEYISRSVETHKDKLNSYFVDLCEQYFEATLMSIKKLFKQHVKLPNIYIIAHEFVRITKAFLSNSKEIHMSDRGLEKLFSWSFFNSITNRIVVQTPIFERFCKVYQDNVKFQHIKVLNLSQVLLMFPVPEGVFKPMDSFSKCEIKDLASRVEFMRMMINNNQSLLLKGPSGSLKSSSINQLIITSPPNHKFIHYQINTTTKLSSFIMFLTNQLLVRKYSQQFILQPKGYDDSKLSIFVDNINTNEQILNFVDSFSTQKYRNIWIQKQNKYLKVSNKLSIHGIVNGRKFFNTSDLKYLLPVSFNIQSQQIILSLYQKTYLKQLIEQNLLSQLIQHTNIAANSIKNINISKKYSSHELYKFLSQIQKIKNVTKQDWIVRMIFVYCSQLKQNKQQAINSIYKAFNIQPIQNIQQKLNATNHLGNNLIKIKKNKYEFENSFNQLKQKLPQLIKYQNKQQIQKLLSSQNEATIYYNMTGDSYLNQFEIISQISYSPDYKFTFILDLQSQEIYKSLYQKYNALIDKSFIVVYQKDQNKKDTVFEKIFQFYKQKLNVNRNNYNLSLEYYEKLLFNNKQRQSKKIQQIQTILANWQTFKSKYEKNTKQFSDKSIQLQQKSQRQEFIISDIKTQNGKLAGLKQELTAKNQELKQMLLANEEAQQQHQLKQSITELQGNIQKLAKKILSKQEQVQLNTKTKETLKTQTYKLKQVLQHFEDVKKGFEGMIGKLQQALVVLHQKLNSDIEDLSLKQTIQQAYLSKVSPQTRKQLLKQFKQQFQASTPQQLLVTFLSLTQDICAIYDPNHSVIKSLNKLYPQQFVIITDLEKLVSPKKDGFQTMYIRETQKQIQYIVEIIRKNNSEKLVLFLDYIPTQYPSIHYQNSLNFQFIQNLVIKVSNKYLNDIIQSSQQKVLKSKKQFEFKKQQCFNILSNGVNSDKVDYLQLLIKKLHQVKLLEQPLNQFENQLSSNLKQKQKFQKLSKEILKFIQFCFKYLLKLSTNYESGSAYYIDLISSTLSKTLKLQQQTEDDYIQNILSSLISTVFVSLRKQHTLTAKFIWCLVKMQMQQKAIDMLFRTYCEEDILEKQGILTQFTKLTKNVDSNKSKVIKRILESKIIEGSNALQNISRFVSSNLTTISTNIIPQSRFYLVQRISQEFITTQIFKQNNYKVISSNIQIQKLDQILSSSNPNFIVIKCESTKKQLQSIYLRCLEPIKSGEKQQIIIFMVDEFENVPYEMLLKCTKLSQQTIELSARFRDRVGQLYLNLKQQQYKQLNVRQKQCFFVVSVTLQLLQLYGIQCLHQFQFFKTQCINIFNNLNQIDLSNRWLFNNLIESLKLKQNVKYYLKIIFFKLIVDAPVILAFDEKDQKQMTIKTTLVKIGNYLQNCNIDLFSVGEEDTLKLKRNRININHKILSFESIKQTAQNKSNIRGVIKQIPLIQTQSKTYMSNSLEQMLQQQVNTVNSSIKQLNTYIAQYNTFVSLKIQPNQYFKNILTFLNNNAVPPVWLGYQPKKIVSLDKYINFFINQVHYFIQLKDNDYKIKSLCIQYIPEPKPIIKKLLEFDQKKTKYQNKILHGRLILQDQQHHSNIQSNGHNQGVILNGLKLRYCKYDHQRLTLQQSLNKTNESLSILLIYGDLSPSLAYEKIPLYKNQCKPDEDPIMNIEVPFKSRNQLHFTLPYYFVTDSFQ